MESSQPLGIPKNGGGIDEKTAAITYNNDGCTIFIFPTPPCRNNSNICL